MHRRQFLLSAGVAGLAPLVGCLGGSDGGRPTTTLDSARVTTTGGADVDVLVAQIVIQEANDGPRVHCRLRNDGPAAATLALRTVLRIDAGGTYEATGYTDVPAGGEVVVEYRIVRYDELTDPERTSVRRGDADFELFVNGEPVRV